MPPAPPVRPLAKQPARPVAVAAAVALRPSGSAVALKAAAKATLKGVEAIEIGRESVSLKLPPSFIVDETWIGDATRKPSHLVGDDQRVGNGRKRNSLASRAERMAAALEEETKGRVRQRQLMDELHEEEMRRISDLGEELEAGMADLACSLEESLTRFRARLDGSFEMLHGNLGDRAHRLVERVLALEARGSVLRENLDEERAARVRENTEILSLLKDRITQLGEGLELERVGRKSRDEDLTAQLAEAIQAIDRGLDDHQRHREERHDATAQEWGREQDRLLKRQERVEQTAEEGITGLKQDTDLERETRIGAQDPITEVLSKFVRDFQVDVKEKAELG